jgi:transposase-like protein
MGSFSRIDVRVPRTREGGFRPFFLEPYKRTSYELEELVVALTRAAVPREIYRGL